MISSAELRHETREDLKAQRKRIAELENALQKLRAACSRYDDRPDNTLCHAAYEEALAVADAALKGRE